MSADEQILELALIEGLWQAAAAVAELIEAASGALNWESGDGRVERQRLRASLANIGGAP